MRNPTSVACLVVCLAAIGCGGGSGSTSGSPPAGPPAAPANPAATAGDRGATVTWDAVPEATSYNLYYAADPSVAPGNWTALTEGAVRSGVASPVQLTGLRPAYGYYFVVTAVNAQGESAPSARVRAVPTGPIPSPTALAATAGDGLALLSWDPVPGATHYTVFWASASGLSATDYLFLPDHGASFVSSAPADSLPQATVDGLVNGRTYHFVVTAFAPTDRESGLSAEVHATPEPGAVACGTGTALARVVTADVEGHILNPSGSTTAVWFEHGDTTAYGSTTAPVQYAIAGAVAHRATLSGLVPTSTRHYRLVAQNAAGTCRGNDRTFRTQQEPAVAASGFDYPTGLALDAQNLYFTAIELGVSTVAKVFAAPLAGGAPVELDASGPLSGAGVGSAGHLALAGTWLVWTRCDDGPGQGQGFVRRVAVTGGGISLGSGLACPQWVAADADFAYWTENGRIARAPLSGAAAPAEVVPTASPPTGLAVDETSVYWLEGAELKKAPLGGGTPTVLALGLSPRRLRMSAGKVYWIESEQSLCSIPVAGGSPACLGPFFAPVRPRDFDLDGEAAFTMSPSFAADQRWVHRIPLAGGAPEPLTWQAGFFAGEILAGPSSVYWSDGYGPAIYEVPKSF